MNTYRTEGWVRKLQGTHPRAWSTSYQDYGYFANPPIKGWLGKSADSAERAASQAASVERLSRPRRPEDHDDIRLLHYPQYYKGPPLADDPLNRHGRREPFPRRRAHPGVRLPPLEEEQQTVAPVHYPSHNYHIRNHLAQMGECLCKFPARPYRDAGAGDPKYLHPVTGRSYKGTPLTWCHYKPGKRRSRPSVNDKIFSSSHREPWNHSYVQTKVN